MVCSIFMDLLRLNANSDSANDMNTNAYKAAIHKVHERTIYEPSNALPFYVRECGGGWACLESRHKVGTETDESPCRFQ